jgi:putative spermidine/putrescine transport system permease protein
MSAVSLPPPPVTPQPQAQFRRRRGRPRIWRGVIFTLAAIYFIGPLAAAMKFGLQEPGGKYGFHNFIQIFKSGALRSSLFTSLEIAGLTVVIVLVLMLPTVVWVRLRLPRVTLMLETVTVLPIVIPPVVMAAGLASLQSHASQQVANLLFNSPVTALTPFYVILALPFTYRALDVGVRAIDLRTLFDASRSLGASWPAALIRVVLPNMRTAVLGAAFLTVALVLGEVVISRILLYTTYPVELIQVGQASAGVAIALSVVSLLFTWFLLLAISFIGGRRGGVSVI